MTPNPFHREPTAGLFEPVEDMIVDTIEVKFKEGDDSIQARFEAFDKTHPEVYVLFCELVNDLRRVGYKHYSADAVLHRIRWEFDVNTVRDYDGFKINDHFSSRYARKWQAAHLEHTGFFETRELKTK